MAATRPVVLVYQEFATLSSTPATPELNVLIAGPAYHIQDFPDDKGKILLKTEEGSILYGELDLPATGTSVAPVPGVAALELAEPPNNMLGALLDAASVKVYFGKAHVEILHDSSAVSTANSPDVTLSVDASEVEAGDHAILTKPDVAGVDTPAFVDIEGIRFTATAAGEEGNGITISIEEMIGGGTPELNETGPSVRISVDPMTATRDDVLALLVGATLVTGALVTPGTGAIAVTLPSSGTLAGGAVGEATPGQTITRTVRAVEGNQITFTDEVDATGYSLVRVERVLPDTKIVDSFVKVAGNSIAIDGGVTIDDLPVTSAEVYVAYRALRTDLQEVKYLNSFDALKGVFGRTLSASETDTRFHSGVDARNPLAVGAAVALMNTNTPVQIYGVGSDNLEGYVAMKGAISTRKDVYAVVPLTGSPSAVAALKTEFENLADPDYAVTNGVPQKFRVVIASVGELPSFGIVVDKNTDGQVVAPSGVAPTAVHTLKFTGGPDLVDAGVLPGFTVTLNSVLYTVTRVNAADELEVAETLVAGTVNGATVVIENPDAVDVYTGTCEVEKKTDARLHLEFLDANAKFVEDHVLPGQYLELPLDPRATTFGATAKFKIAAVVSNQRLRIADAGRDSALVANELPHGFARVADADGKLVAVPADNTLAYRVVKPLDTDGQVSELISVAQSFKSRRAVLCWPDKVDVAGLTDGSLPRSAENPDAPAPAGSQPGYYLACAVGGMTAGLPSHQGFTNLGIAGIDKIYNSNTYFNDRQITQISNNGWCVFQQDTPTSLPYIVHQLTTDPSTLQFGEFSMVKNFDFVSMFFSDILDDYLGIWNINKETFGYIEAALRAGIENLKLKRRVRIGAPIIDAKIAKLGESPVSEDRLEVYVEVDFPKPLNTVGLHIVSV